MTDFSNDENRREFAYTIAAVAEFLGDTYPMLIGGERVAGDETFASLNPSRPSETLARFPVADKDQFKRAVVAAETAFETWQHVPALERAALLRRVADTLRRRRLELAAWCCFEAGLTWAEADAEVAVAIDSLDAHVVADSPAQCAGVFHGTHRSPLASIAARLAAMIGAGDAIVLRPACTVPTVAWKLVEAFVDAGVPAGVLNFVTDVRDGPVSVPDHEPFRIAAAADLGPALEAAFAYAGQRHPNVIHAVVHPDLFDDVAAAALDAAAELVVGPAVDYMTDVGPVIDEAAARRANEFLGTEGDAWFIEPTVLVDTPRVAEPVPGPILTLERGDAPS